MEQTPVVSEFVYKVENLHEIEYGDFKRKLSNYILRLEQGLNSKDPQVKSILRSLRNKIIFNPNGDIESSRADALELAEKL